MDRHVGSLLDLVRVLEAGLLVAERSDAAIAEGAARLLANLPDRTATRAYGERYDWRETGRQHRAILAEAVAEYRSRRSFATNEVKTHFRA